jgi:hypothetical protein
MWSLIALYAQKTQKTLRRLINTSSQGKNDETGNIGRRKMNI